MKVKSEVTSTEVYELWKCICGEEFPVQVWHCPVCLHHWPMHRDECLNCYKGRRLRPLTAKKLRVNEMKFRREYELARVRAQELK